jgi:predicted RNA-binding Zn ribbon-like protein
VPSTPDLNRLEVIGGALCLDLANTIDPRHKQPRVEYLATYRALVQWAVIAGALTAEDGTRLMELGASQPAQGERVRMRAVTLREALYQLLAPGTTGGAYALAVLNEELQRGMASARIEPDGDDYRLGWEAGDSLDRMLWPIARSAGELLLSPQRRRIRECEGSEGCGWLFIDRSKPGTRRWCSMTSCGNREKGTRYRQSRRVGGPALTG